MPRKEFSFKICATKSIEKLINILSEMLVTILNFTNILLKNSVEISHIFSAIPLFENLI